MLDPVLTTGRKGGDMGQVEQWAVAVIADPCGQICVHRGMDSVREFPEEVGDEVHMPRAKQSAI